MKNQRKEKEYPVEHCKICGDAFDAGSKNKRRRILCPSHDCRVAWGVKCAEEAKARKEGAA